ncbi:MAG: hypothetical protein BWY37_02162 [Firmicutes bacterium ADurb.Bin262]|nr:MAG: hypothetical protein BWY37_02162 [Firmicutes bacterium ADurb.Bin262]
MQVPVIAARYAFFREHRKNRLAGAGRPDGRIVKESDGLAAELLRRAHGRPEPARFAPDHLRILRRIFLHQPAPCTAYGNAARGVGVVVDEENAAETVGVLESVHFRHGGPPIVMVAFDEQFPARKRVEKTEIGGGFLQAHRPGKVAGNHDGVFRADAGAPVGLQFFFKTRPALENIHRFGRAERQVGVADDE